MYCKLFGKILDSSIWMEPHPTRIVWFTFLATMDEDGFCQFATVRNVAQRAVVTLEEADTAIKVLESPDAESSDPDHEGRRIERVPGGWMVLNALKYRDLATREHSKFQTRERVRKFRQKYAGNASSNSGNDGNADVTQSNENVTPLEVDVDVKEEGKKELPPPLVDTTPTPKSSLLNTEDFDDQIIARAIQEDHNLIGPYVLGDVTKAVKNIRTKQGIKGDAIRQAFNQRWENYKKSGGTCELAGWMKNGLYITTDKPKTKVLSPAERTRQSMEEWEREKEEKRLQASQRAN